MRNEGENNMLRIILDAVLVLTLQLSVSAQGEQKAQTVQKLYDLSQDLSGGKIVPVRGGTKDKPLGVYLGSKDDIEFRSGYKKVEPKTQCEWAYDLQQFIVKSGGGWDNFQKYLKENPPDTSPTGLLNSSINSYGGGKDTRDAFDRSHVPYDKQAAFADKWWKENSHAYSTSVVPPKDWWIHDAVLDGNNLWMRYDLLNGKGTSEYALWSDSELAKLLKKQ